MQHRKILELIENDIASMDRNRLARSGLLLQSDLWVASSRLDDRKNMEPVRKAELESERDRIKGAIGRIEKRIQKLV